MTLYLIGIGLTDEKDITVNGLEAVRKCNLIYLENYTSKLINAKLEDLEEFYGKKIIIAERETVENKADLILKQAKTSNVALLIIGDVFSATTHINFILEARKSNVAVKIIHNTSILSAISEVGLELYKFGHVTSIPFNNKDIITPIEIFNKNYENALHTLFLLDLDPKRDKYMTINEAAAYLLNKIDGDVPAVGCSAIGSPESEVVFCKLNDLQKEKFEKIPQCIIIPARKLHFVEEEALDRWVRVVK
ncbi:MAG: diphthine synthase [Nanoarchaeota archaeon]